jgi:hypothetical protein
MMFRAPLQKAPATVGGAFSLVNSNFWDINLPSPSLNPGSNVLHDSTR